MKSNVIRLVFELVHFSFQYREREENEALTPKDISLNDDNFLGGNVRFDIAKKRERNFNKEIFFILLISLM